MRSRIVAGLLGWTVGILTIPTSMAGQAGPDPASDGTQAFVDLGTCELEGGGAIRACRVGYRTFGTLNDERSNAVLVPSWFGGTSEALAGFIRPGGLVDPDRYFVVVVDAFGNGISSSPSASSSQRGEAFPRFTIGDMVEAQRRLLGERLDIRTLAGVVGISMGGMQVFEWVVRYPEAVRAAVAIAGTPRAGSYDRVAWDAYLRLMALLSTDVRAEVEPVLAELEYLRGTSPDFVARTVPSDSVGGVLAGFTTDHLTDAQIMDRSAQARAVSTFDVAAPYGGSLDRAADRVRARFTVIVTRSDHQVTPGPSIEFAKRAGASLILLENDCGHAGANCDGQRVLAAVATTLDGGSVDQANR